MVCINLRSQIASCVTRLVAVWCGRCLVAASLHHQHAAVLLRDVRVSRDQTGLENRSFVSVFVLVSMSVLKPNVRSQSLAHDCGLDFDLEAKMSGSVCLEAESLVSISVWVSRVRSRSQSRSPNLGPNLQNISRLIIR